jgi:hypothetical protein
MPVLRNAIVFVISFIFVGSVVSAAVAETQWERNHPRRDQVNDRLANQNRRINRELKEGEITKGQARQLHRDDRAIRQGERALSCKHQSISSAPRLSDESRGVSVRGRRSKRVWLLR